MERDVSLSLFEHGVSDRDRLVEGVLIRIHLLHRDLLDWRRFERLATRLIALARTAQDGRLAGGLIRRRIINVESGRRLGHLDGKALYDSRTLRTRITERTHDRVVDPRRSVLHHPFARGVREPVLRCRASIDGRLVFLSTSRHAGRSARYQVILIGLGDRTVRKRLRAVIDLVLSVPVAGTRPIRVVLSSKIATAQNRRLNSSP